MDKTPRRVVPAAMAVLCALATSFACTPAAPPDPEPKSPPNIVYILADDLGYGELGVYGQELIETRQVLCRPPPAHVIERQHGVRLAAAEIGLQFDHRVSRST